MVIQCCVCNKTRVEGEWIPSTGAEGMVSHTYCPRCLEHAMADLRREMAMTQDRVPAAMPIAV